MFVVVVVGKACGEAVLRGSNVFLKGILGAANHSAFRPILCLEFKYVPNVRSRLNSCIGDQGIPLG